MTTSDSRAYQRAKYLVRAYPGTPEGMTAARWLAARHAAFLAQRGPVQTQEDRNRIQREKYRRNPAPKLARNLAWYFSLTNDRMVIRRKRANARLRERYEQDPYFHKRRHAMQRSRARKSPHSANRDGAQVEVSRSTSSTLSRS